MSAKQTRAPIEATVTRIPNNESPYKIVSESSVVTGSIIMICQFNSVTPREPVLVENNFT